MTKHPIQEGTKVEGNYHGTPFTGTILSWRGKFGGGLEYHIKLDETIYVKDIGGCPRTEVLVTISPTIDSMDYHGLREVE